MKISHNPSAPLSTYRKASGGVLFWGNANEFSWTYREGHGGSGSAATAAGWHSRACGSDHSRPRRLLGVGSLDELAKRQGVSAPGVVADLFGGWPADELNDDFEEAFLHWRECELEQRP